MLYSDGIFRLLESFGKLLSWCDVLGFDFEEQISFSMLIYGILRNERESGQLSELMWGLGFFQVQNLK